jgi:hypothetical protein
VPSGVNLCYNNDATVSVADADRDVTVSEATMTQAQLLSEFRQLSLAQQLEIIQAFVGIVAQHMQAAEQNTNRRDKHKRLAEAANLLLEDYETDQELTSFTVLDGEPFHA